MTSVLRFLRICIVIFVALVPVVTAIPQLSAQPRIRGTIVDPYGKPIVGTSIQVSGSGKKYQVATTRTGFTISLPPGTYSLELQPMGFCKVIRGPFVLVNNSDAVFDFQLFVCGTDTVLPEEGYKHEELPNTKGLPVPAVMQFGCHNTQAGGNRYIGIVDSGRYFPPILTYNLMTVKANSMDYHVDTHTLHGEGDIVWQDGNRKEGGPDVEQIEIVFSSPEPSVWILKTGETRWRTLSGQSRYWPNRPNLDLNENDIGETADRRDVFHCSRHPKPRSMAVIPSFKISGQRSSPFDEDQAPQGAKLLSGAKRCFL